jgi:GNAT superfamily N-acetyltransferase
MLPSLPAEFLLRNTLPEDAPQLENLQKLVFPSLAANELLRAEHYLAHMQIFPEGQMVIIHEDEVVAMTTTMRCFFDFNHYQHSFSETIAGGWMTNHNPEGDWLYGLDLGVHPNFRRRGLSKYLYQARQQLAQKLGLRGQLTVGMLNGYGQLQNVMSPEQYYSELITNQRTDPTVTPQLKIGFEPIALVPDYVHDHTCGNYGVLLKWEL